MILTLGLDGQDTPTDIDALIDAGAGEFFAGFVPAEWSERYGWEVPLNRRTFGASSQYTSIEELGEAIRTARRRGIAVTVAFNAHDYGGARLPLVRDIVLHLDQLDPGAYVVADPALMVMFRRWGIDRPLHLSTGAGCFNSEAVRFFVDMAGVRRVVLPRKLTLREMGCMMAALADVDLEFEVMAIGYRCFFNDSLCFSLHSGASGNLCGEFSQDLAEVTPRFPNTWKQTLEAVAAAPYEQFVEGSALDRFRHALTCPTVVPAPPRPAASGMDAHLASTFFGNCGLCSIPALRAMGVQVLKIPVRGSTWHKARYLELVRKVLEHPSPSPESCRELINSAGFCSETGACYYHVGTEGD